MLSSELNEIFSNHLNLKNLYDGTFSFDKVPKQLAVNHFIIINFSDSNQIGSHWFTVYRESRSCLQCFDSLGLTDDKVAKVTHLFAHFNLKEIIYNKSQLQKSDTISCGQYVLYFIFQRLMNLDLKFSHLLNEIFTLDLEKNEKKVSSFYENIILEDNGQS